MWTTHFKHGWFIARMVGYFAGYLVLGVILTWPPR